MKIPSHPRANRTIVQLVAFLISAASIWSSALAQTTTVTFLASEQMVSVANEFNRASGNIKVNIVTINDKLGDNESERLLRSSVDIAVLESLNWGYLIQKGYILNLEKLLKDDSWASRRVSSVTPSSSTVHGLFGLPIAHVPFMVYANRNMLAEAGMPTQLGRWTWDEFSLWVIKLTAPNKPQYGTTLHLRTWALPFIQAGGHFIGGPYELARKGLEMVYKLQSAYRSNAAFEGSGESPFNYFSQGVAATFVGTSFEAQVLASKYQFGTPRNWDWISLPLPSDPANKVGVDWGLIHLAISAFTPRYQEAWRFLKWLMTPPGEQALVRAGQVPVFVDAETLPVLKKIYGEGADSFAGAFKPMVDNTNLQSISVANAASSQIENIVSKYFSGELGLDAAISELNYRTSSYKY